MSCLPHCSNTILCLALAAGCMSSCRQHKADATPFIQFSQVPPAEDGSPEQVETIEGRVSGARPGQRVVLFALSGVWWIQPTVEHPFTPIQPDSTWKSSTHPGSRYAALLVDASYRVPLTMNALPEAGGSVLAVTDVPGVTPSVPRKTVQFSGYQWQTRQAAVGAGESAYDPANVWTDDRGFLHLRVTRERDRWVRAEVKLSRSLGYGSYRFVVEDVSHLEPAAVFAMFTFDDFGPSREMDIEIGRWSEPEDKNAQYVVQPYAVPANTIRFEAPAGTLTYWIDWQPGRVSYKTSRGARSNAGGEVVAQHVFTSGVPPVGNERIRMNLYVYDERRHPVQHEFEVVIEKFEFLP
jgi:hypothetical protein